MNPVFYSPSFSSCCYTYRLPLVSATEKKGLILVDMSAHIQYEEKGLARERRFFLQDCCFCSKSSSNHSLAAAIRNFFEERQVIVLNLHTSVYYGN